MKKFFTVRWILTTLLAISGVIILVFLGIWQLDRLEQRRAFNERVSTQIDAPELSLNQNLAKDLHSDLEYRSVVVRGTVLPGQEILWRNQPNNGQPGFHILTPIKITGSEFVVLIDRGWIPLAEGSPERLKKYQVIGEIVVNGVVRRTQPEPGFGGVPDPTLAPGQLRLDGWNFIDLTRIQVQFTEPLLPVFVQQKPGANLSTLPYKVIELPTLDEGPHLGYAIQWFTFAAILAIGYPFFVCRSLSENARKNNG